ncbi:MAG: methylated-DNA--[protein]-cysteine S-methyltransferase [Chloroflexota bacterium]|nr:methylated-DNA--[protein]-cysteine S-methyltransferase [Chloroflexota bacterium]
MTHKYTVFDTEFGWMAIVGSELGLCKLTLPQPAADKALTLIADYMTKAVAGTSSFRDLIERLELYFRGDYIDFPDDLDLRGSTAFQRDVWELTCSIPYGKTRTYKWVATEMGRPGSLRAVGQALARNPLPIIIPCHRVIGSSGSIGGFSGGLDMKKRLITLESISK